jgi:UDP-N-acetylglucosamine:LPS N-acetylglucosamine transferase
VIPIKNEAEIDMMRAAGRAARSVLEKLAGMVSELLHNENEISTLKNNIAAFARPNATDEIVDTLINVVYGRA